MQDQNRAAMIDRLVQLRAALRQFADAITPDEADSHAHLLSTLGTLNAEASEAIGAEAERHGVAVPAVDASAKRGMSTTRKGWIAAAVVVVAIVGWFVVDASYESCGEWKQRHIDALSRSMVFVAGYDTSREDLALAMVESQRPAGCR